MKFPSPKMRVALFLYRLFWVPILPLVVIYLAYRGRRDPDYFRWLRERFGFVARTKSNPVWIHAVSIGEFRSALPLIERLFKQGETIHITCFTPAGRREAQHRLRNDIKVGRASISWVPLELAWAYRIFFARIAPKYGLVMEIEVWPRMISSARACSVPLMMCNAQYPLKSFERDTTRASLRAELMTGFTGALVKSELQKQRFTAVGQTNIAITGELRFDQPLPRELIERGEDLRHQFWPSRPTYCFASVIEGEDKLIIDTIELIQSKQPNAAFVYVPRAPERFEEVADMLSKAGLSFVKRSDCLNANFQMRQSPCAADILLGDSLGEMYGYLAMADKVIVGGGFVPKGAHNISEAMALGKPVWTGPYIWTIEYPAVEAKKAGVLTQSLATPQDLSNSLLNDPVPEQDTISDFFNAHSGAGKRTLAAIPHLLEAATKSR